MSFENENWFAGTMEEEVPYSEIKAKADAGEFHKWNFEPFDFQENGYEDVIDEIKKYSAVKYLDLQKLRDSAKKAGNEGKVKEYQAKMDKMVDDVLAIYREKNIFPIAPIPDAKGNPLLK